MRSRRSFGSSFFSAVMDQLSRLIEAQGGRDEAAVGERAARMAGRRSAPLLPSTQCLRYLWDDYENRYSFSRGAHDNDRSTVVRSVDSLASASDCVCGIKRHTAYCKLFLGQRRDARRLESAIRIGKRKSP
jgi:hypothetical protein